MSRKFMHVSIAILCLALAYHLGARSVGAQSSGDVIGYAVNSNSTIHFVYLSNGDVYARQGLGNSSAFTGPVEFIGNYFGGPTPVEHPSLGQLKARYR